MKRINRGSGFKGVLSYLLDHDAPEIIAGTISFGSVLSMTSEFIALSETRSDIGKPVWHNSLRLPKTEHLEHHQWVVLAEDYINEMGFSPGAQWIAIKHNHANGEHIHIVANRVQPEGQIYLGKNENLISTKVISKLEVKHGLAITKSAELANDGSLVMPEKSKPKKKRWNVLCELVSHQPDCLFSH